MALGTTIISGPTGPYSYSPAYKPTPIAELQKAARDKSLARLNAAYSKGVLSSATLAAVQKILSPTSIDPIGVSKPYYLAVGQQLSNLGINLKLNPSDPSAQYAVTLSAQGGVLGVPSSATSGSVVQISGTAQQIANTLLGLTFEATDAGPGSVAVTGLENAATGGPVTADGTLLVPITVTPTPALPGPVATGGKLVVSSINTDSSPNRAGSEYFPDYLRSDDFTKLRGYAFLGGSSGAYTATLTVDNGDSILTAAGAATVTSSRTGGTTVSTITGTAADVNATLASLQLKGNAVSSYYDRSSWTVTTLSVTDGAQTAKATTSFINLDLSTNTFLQTYGKDYNRVDALTRSAPAGEVIDASGFYINTIFTSRSYTATLRSTGGTIAVGTDPLTYQVKLTGSVDEINAQLDKLVFRSESGGGSVWVDSVTLANGEVTHNRIGLVNGYRTRFSS